MVKEIRKIVRIITSKHTLEGAGVKLKRVFGHDDFRDFDPFLMLDNFGSENPRDYMPGFPWHPHRGMETVTYMINGEVEHEDSLGNKGLIRSGDVQWMTAGSGIIHQEMPRPFVGKMQGLQLWINLPQKNKMTPPKYQGFTKKEFPTFDQDETKIILLAGNIGDKKSPLQDTFVEIEYLDVDLKGKFEHHTAKKTVFIFVYVGMIEISGRKISVGQCALLEKKGKISVEGKAKFIFVAGNPLAEPVAWSGPIVMNDQKELDQAFAELRQGSFTKS